MYGFRKIFEFNHFIFVYKHEKPVKIFKPNDLKMLRRSKTFVFSQIRKKDLLQLTNLSTTQTVPTEF